MSNCGRQGRSRNPMLVVPNLRPKVVPHGPRLLPRFIVRTRGRLVAGASSLHYAQEAWSSGPAFRPRGHHSGPPRAVAPLSQRARLLALRFGALACLLPVASGERVCSFMVASVGSCPFLEVSEFVP